MLRRTRTLVTSQPVNLSHPLARGLRAWWLVHPALNGAGTTWNDFMRGTVGTLTTMALPPTALSGWSLSTKRPGGFGELRFDGSSDYVDCGNPEHLRLTGAMTLSCWARSDDITTTSGRFIAKQGEEPLGSWSLHFEDKGATSAYAFHLSADGTAFKGLEGPTSNPPVVGVWAHVAGVYVPSTSMTLYKNGQPIATTTTAVPAAQFSNTTMRLGSRPHTSATRHEGALDDLRIYDVALSASEILALYTNSMEGYPGLLQMRVAHWPGFTAAAAGSGPLVGPGRLVDGSPLVGAGRLVAA